MGKGGRVSGDGTELGTGRVDQTQLVVFSGDETADVGREAGTTVSPDRTAHSSRFNGTVNWSGEDAKDADLNIDTDERFRMAMARQ